MPAHMIRIDRATLVALLEGEPVADMADNIREAIEAADREWRQAKADAEAKAKTH